MVCTSGILLAETDPVALPVSRDLYGCSVIDLAISHFLQRLSGSDSTSSHHPLHFILFMVRLAINPTVTVRHCSRFTASSDIERLDPDF